MIGGKKGIRVDVRPTLEWNDVGAELGQMTANLDAMALVQPFACDRARGDPYGGLARRLPASAAIIAYSVFLPIRVIGVTGTKGIGDVRVVLAPRILVADQKRNRRSGGAALEHAGQYLDGIGLPALTHMPRRARTAAVEIALNVGFGEGKSRRTTVHDAADRGSMGFAERCDGKQSADGVAGHGR